MGVSRKLISPMHKKLIEFPVFVVGIWSKIFVPPFCSNRWKMRNFGKLNFWLSICIYICLDELISLLQPVWWKAQWITSTVKSRSGWPFHNVKMYNFSVIRHKCINLNNLLYTWPNKYYGEKVSQPCIMHSTCRNIGIDFNNWYIL